MPGAQGILPSSEHSSRRNLHIHARSTAINTQSQKKSWQDRLDLGAYTTTETAWLAGTTRQMVLSWWRLAYVTENGPGPTAVGQPILLSYLQLVETAVAISLRAHGIRFADIAATRSVLQQRFREQAPFASEKLREDWPLVRQEAPATTDRSNIAHDDEYVVHWRTALGERLTQFEYGDGLVHRWYPHGRDGIVVVDPRLAFGAPIIVGTAIPIHIIEERFASGETEVEIAEDFGIDTRQVVAALDLHRPKKRHVA